MSSCKRNPYEICKDPEQFETYCDSASAIVREVVSEEHLKEVRAIVLGGNGGLGICLAEIPSDREEDGKAPEGKSTFYS